jgi:uncharacterized membrane protein YbhN (UPF0104 family)
LAIVGLAIVALVICGQELVSAWPSVSRSLASANYAYLVAAAVASAFAMIGLAALWRSVLAVFSRQRPLREVVPWYFAGEVSKYLPGGIWAVIGRGELAWRGGIRRSVAYPSVIISLGLGCVGAMAAISLLLPWLPSPHRPWFALVAATLIAFVALSCRPEVIARVLRAVRRVSRDRIELETPSFLRSLGLVALAIPPWLLTGAASVAIAAAFGYEQHPEQVAIAAIAGWLVGFIAVPNPAGAGLREYTFAILSGLQPGHAVAVAAIARVFFMAVDGLGGGLALLVVRRQRTETIEVEA